jgi:hypothetical protein
MIVDICNETLQEIQKYKCKNKDELLYKYIRERLDSSYKSYVKELSESVEYLSSRDNLRVFKKVTKGEK